LSSSSDFATNYVESINHPVAGLKAIKPAPVSQKNI
jgi:hypothetical protein